MALLITPEDLYLGSGGSLAKWVLTSDCFGQMEFKIKAGINNFLIVQEILSAGG